MIASPPDLWQHLLLSTYKKACAAGFLDSSFGRWMFERGYNSYKRWLEAPYVPLLRQYIPTGSLVLDIGANIGFFTLRFSEFVGPSGHVIAAEPETTNFERLSRRVEQKKLTKRVTCVRALVAEQEGELPLEINPFHPADHKIGTSGPLIPAITLDRLRQKSSLPLSFVKIDVQGAEYRVLSGGLQTLKKERPALLLELDSGALERMGSSVSQICELLKEFQYLPWALTRHAAEAINFAELDQADGKYSDILFVANQ